MAWCEAGAARIWAHRTFAPCWFESVIGAAFLLLAILTAIFNLGKFRTAPLRQRASGQQKLEWVCAACYCLLVLHHLVWLIYGAVAHVSESYEKLFDGSLLATWSFALAAAVLEARTGRGLRLRTLIWPAIPVYAWQLYTGALMRRGGWGPAHVRGPAGVAHLASTAAALAAAILASVGEARRQPSATTAGSLKEALIQNTSGDVESRGPQKSRGWWRLLLTAILYVWPESFGLQLRAAICVLIVCAVRGLNIAVPLLYKKVVDTLADASSRTHPRGIDPPETFAFWQIFYPYVLAYLAALFFQGGLGVGASGILNNARQFLWIPISQDAYRRISLDVFAHTLDLDLNFHLHRKTGEVMRIMDRGTSSIQNILSTVFFSIGPQIFDIIAACTYLAAALEPWIAVVVFITLISYIPLTVALTEWRGKFRRDQNQLDNAKSARATDAMLNYETVKYFTNEALERDNFGAAIAAYQRMEFKLLASLNGLNIVQFAILFSGLTTGLIVCVKGVAQGDLTVGDAVLFITLMQQLFAPLNYFGTYYRTIQKYMIDLENMFDLLAAHPQIQDKPDAKPYEPASASIEFDNVSFEYSVGMLVLDRVSFRVAGGKTLALVGATGSGKSSCLRLLFRFYDPTSGVIRIDGQDIRDLRQASLRRVIGVVPQDTVLFNDTIKYNIRYGSPSCSDEQVEKAAAAASIHDAIVMRFPQGYETVVGERGLRLSGGEKQRVAFARTILKDPSLLLLDEATSALDSLTEQRIQEALALLRHLRTTIIVAHRLSTVMDADVIVVLKEGRVVETGTHPELVAASGHYAEMWSRQREAAITGGSAGGSQLSLASNPSFGDVSKHASLASLAEAGSSSQTRHPHKGH